MVNEIIDRFSSILRYGVDFDTIYRQASVLYKGRTCPLIVSASNMNDISYRYVDVVDGENTILVLNADLPKSTIRSIMRKEPDEWESSSDLGFFDIFVKQRTDMRPIYETAITLCRELGIPCPQIFVIVGGFIPNRSAFTIHDENTGEIISIVLDENTEYIRSLAHELRHIWQQSTGMKMYDINPNEDPVGYAFHPTEVDAEAYAALVCEKMNLPFSILYPFDGYEEALYDRYQILKKHISGQ